MSLSNCFLDLLREVALRSAGQGDPGDLRVCRFGDAEAPDVVPPTAEDAGDPGEHPRLIVDEQRNGMFFNGHNSLSLFLNSFIYSPLNMGVRLRERAIWRFFRAP